MLLVAEVVTKGIGLRGVRGLRGGLLVL